MDVGAIALSGMQAAQRSVETAARRIASPEQSGDMVDLSAEMAGLLAAKNQFAANVQVAKIADDMQKHTIELFA